MFHASIPRDHDRQVSGLAREGIESAKGAATHDDADRFLLCH